MEEKDLGGEVAKCVAMNPKNGMKRRANEKKRKKGRGALNGWAELCSIKKPER